MILGHFHQGSGLGNQIFRYIATRTIAEKNGYNWGMIYGGHFKGDSFMNLEVPNKFQFTPTGFDVWNEKKIIENGVDIRGYDPEFNFVEDNTIIDGEFQDFRYFADKIIEMDEWFKVEPIEIPEDTCVIGFRGGEYTVFPDLFLPKAYWAEAIDMMKSKGIKKFEVHTDDVETAKQFFPEYECIHDIGLNWRAMRYAQNTIIANSSFYIIPRLLRSYDFDRPETIAPKYWARHNTQTWALPQNYYSCFSYI